MDQVRATLKNLYFTNKEAYLEKLKTINSDLVIAYKNQGMAPELARKLAASDLKGQVENNFIQTSEVQIQLSTEISDFDELVRKFEEGLNIAKTKKNSALIARFTANPNHRGGRGNPNFQRRGTRRGNFNGRGGNSNHYNGYNNQYNGYNNYNNQRGRGNARNNNYNENRNYRNNDNNNRNSNNNYNNNRRNVRAVEAEPSEN
jgi:hypothetical protein